MKYFWGLGRVLESGFRVSGLRLVGLGFKGFGLRSSGFLA